MKFWWARSTPKPCRRIEGIETQFDEVAWVPKANKRKAYRDHHREEFFREVGLSKGTHVQDITGAPEQQRNHMQTLLALTAKGSVNDVHRTWVAATADALQTAGLGVGAMGAVSENRDLLERYSMKNLRDKWF